MTTSAGVSRWTRRFAVGSALATVGLQVAFLFDASLRVVAVVGLFGAVLPMVFGMAYLLIPSYAGQTLSTPRLPGVHLVVTYAGVGLLLWYELLGGGGAVWTGGVVAWSAGVACFLGALLRTVLPAVGATVERATSDRRPQRSTRLALLAIPVALGYLVVGTGALVSTVAGVPDPLGATVPVVVHLYATGFVALLIFALGPRLLTGFFHVTPPRSLSWLVLSCGSLAPGVLALTFYRPPWFLVGAGLEFVAVAGYAALVAVVAIRTDRRDVGIVGIGLGGIGGVVAVGVALGTVLGVAGSPGIATHVVVVLDGFLVLTIVGYAVQFFPVTTGGFWGATDRTTTATTLAVGAGTGLHATGVAGGGEPLQVAGVAVTLGGTVGYAYLLSRRVL